MSLSSDLITLARYMAGEFDNQEQANAEPAWYVYLRLWQRPVSLFTDDSVTLFAEQANVAVDQPYRQRLLRLKPADTNKAQVQVQYYSFKEPASVKGAGQNPERLNQITIEQINQLPGCLLNVTQLQPAIFAAFPPPNLHCYFDYDGAKREVSLGFEASPTLFKSYDKGIDPETGKAIWGALLGPYQFIKRQDYPIEFGS